MSCALIATGAIGAVLGGYVWHRSEIASTHFNILGAVIIAISAIAFIFPGVLRFISTTTNKSHLQAIKYVPPLWICILLIFIGSMSYTVAAYIHLKLENSWTFLAAFTIALPLILLEYQFSIRGNHYAHMQGLNAVQITLITMCFYFINSWVLNKFVLRRNAVIWWRELMAFVCILVAFMLST